MAVESPAPPAASAEARGAPDAAPVHDGLDRSRDALARLRATVAGAAGHFAAFQRAVEARLELLRAYSASAAARLHDLSQRYGAAQARAEALGRRLRAAEEQTSRMTSLYVATFELHATLDVAAVARTVGDIVENMLGVERYTLLWRADDEPGVLEPLRARGVEPAPGASAARYRGGDPVVDAALADGATRVGPFAGSPLLAVVPLQVQGSVHGALVLHELLAHKEELAANDREMLELLASHAATALFLAGLHAKADRKLRSLTDLVALARPR